MKKLNLREGDYINILSSKNLDTIFGNIPRSVNLKVIGFLIPACTNMTVH